MADAYDVSTGAAYAVLYSVLSVFTILAILSAGYGGSCIPGFLVAKSSASVTVAGKADDSNNDDGGASSSNSLATDFFLSARNSTGTFGIAMSFFASGMGAWVVYGTTEMGATPQLSWLGVLGYALASAIPGIVVAFIGPMIKDATDGEQAFSTTDFCKIRYGRVMQLVCAAISVFYMWIYLVAELTSISNVFALLVGKDLYYGYDQINFGYTTGIAISIGVFTIFYTGIAGLPASIVTDKFQGVLMTGLVLILTFAVCGSPQNSITYEEFQLASNWTADGAYAMIILFIAILSAELFNQATWQRVWAAKDTKSLRSGFLIGSALVFFLMMFFGIMGFIAYAKDPVSYDTYAKYAYLAFFDLLLPLQTGWHVLVLIFVTSLAASSIDSLQNGITSVLSSDLVSFLSPNIIVWINRLVLIGVNVAAIVKSAQRYNVLSLFLVADLVCATSVFPVFMGLLPTEKYGILAPTEFGAFMGCIGGFASVLVIGCVIDYKTYGSNPFNWFWLADASAPCALCGTNRMWTFIIVPIVSIISTVCFTFVDKIVRGEEGSRKSMLRFSFDENNKADKMEEKDFGDNVDEP